jgi:hypothetical protein
MRILQDIFPAVISMTTTQPTENAPLTAKNPATALAAHKVDRARVIVTDERIIVALDSPEGPTVIFNQAYDPETALRSKNRNTDSFVTTKNEQPIYVAYSRYDDCSCGSRLRGWNPFGSVTSSASIKD